jgi:hypothetical protein
LVVRKIQDAIGMIKFRSELNQLLDLFDLTGYTAEIGVAEGRFSEIMMSWDRCEAHYMIDAWQQLNQRGDGGFPDDWHMGNYSEAMARTAKYSDRRIVWRGKSFEQIPFIPDDQLVLAYVDADHSYEGCKRDLDLIWPKIQSGGILSGHDFLAPEYGVGMAVIDFAEQRGLTINLIEDEEPAMASFWIAKPI